MSELPDKGLETLFFRNRHLLGLAIVVILIGGLSAAVSLPRLEDPRIVNRDPIIVTPFPGASAERVEALVTEVLEESLDEIDAIKDIESVSRAGVSILSVELDPEVGAGENERIFAEIRDKVSDVVPRLPADAQTPFVDDKRDPSAFTLIVGISWDSEREARLGLLNRLADELADRLREVDGTELVRVYGAAREEILVEVDRQELAELGISAEGIAARIGEADSKGPAGVLRGERSDLLVEVEGELDSVGRIAKVPLTTNDGGSILQVGDIARVARRWQAPEEEIALVDGRRSVLVAARVDGDVRVDRWADDTDAVLESFAAQRGEGLRVDRVFEQEHYTSTQLRTLLENLLAGAAVVLLVVLVIMGARPAFVVAFALPLVVGCVLIGFQITGNAIHQMSIYGMIIALGLLIDNAIVMTDEVVAHKARGATSLQAVRDSVRHLFRPLLASTITTILAFAPIMLLPGSAGDFVGSIGTSVILAITASFLIAMTITASLAGIFARPSAGDRRRRWWRDGVSFPFVAKLYRHSLRGAYAVPIVAILIALVLPAAGFSVARTLGNQFFPPIDRDMFEIRLRTPSDSAIHATLEDVREVETTLRSIEGIENVSWLVGGSFPTVYYNLVMNQDRSPSYAQAIVTTSSASTTKRILDRVQSTLDREHPGVQIMARQFAQGPPLFADIEVRLFGTSVAKMQDLGDRIRREFQAHPDVLHTVATIPRGEPKLFFRADEDATRLAGLTLAGVASQLQGGLEGEVRGSVIEDLESMPVRVRYADASRRDLQEVASTPLVQSGQDRWISAHALGNYELRPEAGGLTHFDGARTNILNIYVRNGALPIDVESEVLASLTSSGFTLPDGYHMEFGGASEQDTEAKGNLAAHAPILATIMVATLILAFRSVRYSMILGGVAVLSLGLALLSTWSIGFPISFNTILGTLGLIGVALNDSIVVLAAIRAHPGARAGDREGIVQAVMDSTRHVIATTATTIGGFLPLLLFVGGDFWPSLAIVLAGGIAGASLVALFFVPGAYILMTRKHESTAVAPTLVGAET